jgi:hypothetical protein
MISRLAFTHSSICAELKGAILVRREWFIECAPMT